ncbi:amino acid ABC transporter permease [Nocardioides sp.]|uniref:amino acid ABC transporter permease n=1 Tax=Nocardioides sp. TaxID=35761 RepID=UPI002B26E29F|nr:amino acid ABC transporter permease [Nocardioides sp.]
MAASVLFDAPGPKTVARHRVYTVAAYVGLLAVLAFIAWKLNESGQFAYALWEPVLTPNIIEVILVDGLLNTLKMAFSAIVLAVIFGLAFGIGKMSEHAWVRWPCWAVVEFFRAVPVLLLMVFIFYQFGGVTNGDPGAYWSVVAALTLYNGAVLAEVFRAGVNAVPAGQAEAAYALGMRKSQVMLIIMLPQAVKIMLPSIISQCVVALKDTSLGYAIAAVGLSTVSRLVYIEYGNQLQVVFVVAMLYISVNMVLTWIATLVQKRFVGEKSPIALESTDEPV